MYRSVKDEQAERKEVGSVTRPGTNVKRTSINMLHSQCKPEDGALGCSHPRRRSTKPRPASFFTTRRALQTAAGSGSSIQSNSKGRPQTAPLSQSLEFRKPAERPADLSRSDNDLFGSGSGSGSGIDMRVGAGFPSPEFAAYLDQSGSLSGSNTSFPVPHDRPAVTPANLDETTPPPVGPAQNEGSASKGLTSVRKQEKEQELAILKQSTKLKSGARGSLGPRFPKEKAKLPSPSKKPSKSILRARSAGSESSSPADDDSSDGRPRFGIQVDEEREAGEKRSSPNEPRPPEAESSRPEGVPALAVDLAKDRALLSNAPTTLSNPAKSVKTRVPAPAPVPVPARVPPAAVKRRDTGVPHRAGREATAYPRSAENRASLRQLSAPTVSASPSSPQGSTSSAPSRPKPKSAPAVRAPVAAAPKARPSSASGVPAYAKPTAASAGRARRAPAEAKKEGHVSGSKSCSNIPRRAHAESDRLSSRVRSSVTDQKRGGDATAHPVGSRPAKTPSKPSVTGLGAESGDGVVRSERNGVARKQGRASKDGAQTNVKTKPAGSRIGHTAASTRCSGAESKVADGEVKVNDKALEATLERSEVSAAEESEPAVKSTSVLTVSIPVAPEAKRVAFSECPEVREYTISPWMLGNGEGRQPMTAAEIMQQVKRETAGLTTSEVVAMLRNKRAASGKPAPTIVEASPDLEADFASKNEDDDGPGLGSTQNLIRDVGSDGESLPYSEDDSDGGLLGQTIGKGGLPPLRGEEALACFSGGEESQDGSSSKDLESTMESGSFGGSEVLGDSMASVGSSEAAMADVSADGSASLGMTGTASVDDGASTGDLSQSMAGSSDVDHVGGHDAKKQEEEERTYVVPAHKLPSYREKFLGEREELEAWDRDQQAQRQRRKAERVRDRMPT